MKNCSICGIDISHKKSNNASKCEKCSRILNEHAINKIKDRTKYMGSVKDQIMYAYDSCCVICQWSIPKQFYNGKYQRQAGCDVHHIIPVSAGGKHTFENCILLCPNHHKEADLGILTEEFLFSYVAKNKEELIEAKKDALTDAAADILCKLF